MPSSHRDSVHTVVEALVVEQLRAAGFEVVDKEKGVAICKRLADSLGGNFDRRKGRVDPEREAVLVIQTRLTLVAEYNPDALIFWSPMGSNDGRGLAVYIEDIGGTSVYRNEIEKTGYDYADLVRAVLEPFCYAVRPISDPSIKGSGRR